MISLLKVAVPRLDKTRALADGVVAFAESGSTHADARDMIGRREIALSSDLGLPVTVITADYLSNALVRFGRQWITAPGKSLTATFVTVIPTSVADDEMANGWLEMIAGLSTMDALGKALDACGARPYEEDCGFRIKWPNDLYCHDLKLGGTVTEVLPLPDDVTHKAVVCSVGINLMMPADRLPTPQATSLQMNVGPLPPVDELRDAIISGIVTSLRRRLGAFVQDPAVQAESLREEMGRVCWMMGRTIDAQLIDGSAVHGEVIALNDDASISVRTDNGDVRSLLASEVGLLQ
ncbi:biotin--[acetyl-CoA-carboxylase] ligase [Bifidobacterium platyrrhinorum]|uniref:Biotin--acetyl-CoA-carboxylase ligase n=1 Tax=Bifidobacterium platyrrhinorum TaxID=2661628 RepID=A0A6L9SR87_9BIFI|nr:biotin--acetyl-CoA-carboxylase ligase [Bifidobacterium platyrrhinorum]NEG54968.1 biotin--acetyl-CoA-carboxylase ligase [Bifidobacterium platyrrhinorum]